MKDKVVLRTPIFYLTKTKHIFRLISPNWANVIALNEKKELLMIKQYRHGTRSITLETPGGLIDKKDKSPLDAAKRELMEETGYSSKNWKYLGWVHANPAYQNNKCFFFLAKNVKKTGVQNLDKDEDIKKILFIPLKEVEKKIFKSEISNSIVVANIIRFLITK